MKKIPEIIIETSRKLRKEMTLTEDILWNKLKAKRFKNKKFVRQFPIYVYTEDSGLDRYIIPDFICREDNLIIELDGNIHNKKEVYELDKYKEKLLIQLGYKILRIKNEDIINNIDKSLTYIAASFPG
ncbi:MAG: endonuclease domain-containing protein [Candidatus Gracilibacteria bacterium]|nr:endonuclease domain-containing protein [Candidatus Gracilibacteria bacterium]